MMCPTCNEAELNVAIEAYKYEESGLNVTLEGVEVRSCPSCGERMAAIPAIGKLHRELARTIICKRSRLAPEEIRFLRTHLGRSRADFAKQMGVGREQVSRWETGKSPIGAASDRLIRTMRC
jgi:putative zinc finger/helix-turn-helix YgiT family protein